MFIDHIQHVPHVPGEGTWLGADCWGVVELYYRHVLGIELGDRGQIEPGCAGVQEWSEARASGSIDCWRELPGPVDHCLVVMRMGEMVAGHVGVFFRDRVLHSARRRGCVYQPLRDRRIACRVTSYLELST